MSGSYINQLTSKAEHDKLLSSRGDKLAVINASAAWCGPCVSFYLTIITMARAGFVGLAHASVDRPNELRPSRPRRSTLPPRLRQSDRTHPSIVIIPGSGRIGRSRGPR